MSLIDPVRRMAMLRAISASADIEAQLNKQAENRPVLILLMRAREAAAEALEALATLPVDEATPAEIRSLQNEVRRYDDIVKWLREIVHDGFDYDREISDEDREEMIDLLMRTPEGQREAEDLGLLPTSPNQGGF